MYAFLGIDLYLFASKQDMRTSGARGSALAAQSEARRWLPRAGDGEEVGTRALAQGELPAKWLALERGYGSKLSHQKTAGLSPWFIYWGLNLGAYFQPTAMLPLGVGLVCCF